MRGRRQAVWPTEACQDPGPNPNINGARPVECAIAAVACVAPSLATRSQIRCDSGRGWKARQSEFRQRVGHIADDAIRFLTANNATPIVVGKSAYSRCLEICMARYQN